MMDSVKHGKVVTDHMIPSARRLIGRGYTFMQDNASCHKSKAKQTLLRNTKANLLPHPPQSPDLNPIGRKLKPAEAVQTSKRRETLANYSDCAE